MIRFFSLLLFICINVCLAQSQVKPVNTTFVKAVLKTFLKDKAVGVKLDFTYFAFEEGQTQAHLYLSSDFKIDKLDGKNIEKYEFDYKASPFPTINILFKKPLSKKEATYFSIQYSGKPQKGFWLDDFQWIEFDNDFFIFPVFSNFQFFTYSLQASIDDPAYRFIDRDKLVLSNNVTVAIDKPNYYFPSLSACRNVRFDKFTESGAIFTIISNQPDSSVKQMAHAALSILKYYNNTFGKSDQRKSAAILWKPLPQSVNPLEKTEETFIVLTSDTKEDVLQHEISHFWWNRGNASTMDKWLSESFAVYSHLLYVRNAKGLKIFMDEITNLESESVNLPALLTAERFGQYGNDLIYEKGPYLLYILEKMIGEEKFITLLDRLNKNKVATTTDFLSELEKVSSKEERAEFEKGLR